jgi:hypothetical protein
LQRYGAFCGDFAGANVIYAENSPEAVREWNGVLASDDLKAVFTPDFIRAHFRVIAMGNLMPGQNLSVPPPYLMTFAIAGQARPAVIDQLTRHVAVSPRGSVPLNAHWTVFPRSTRITLGGRALNPDVDVVNWSKPQTLVLTAPDGRQTTWQFSPR